MMAWSPSKESPAPLWRSPRVIAALLVGVLHAAALAFILFSAHSGPAVVTPLQREVFFLFPPPAKAPSRLPHRIEAIARRAPALFRYAPSTAITLPPAASTPLEVSLLRCAPENLANLSLAERAKCGEAYSARAFDAPDGDGATMHALDAERWRAALAERDTGVPCATVERIEVDRARREATNAVMTDPLCVLRQLTDGAAE